MYFLLGLSAMISLGSGAESCSGSLGSAGANEYECWDTNGILKDVQFPLCVSHTQRCDKTQRCNCPWCDDEWNCPTFDECKANGGFLCPNSYLPNTNELWVCIPQEWLCDGIWDCPSGEDESRDFCNVNKCEDNHNLTYWYQCSDTGRCIDVWTVGNGEMDCVNGEDENPSVIAKVADFFTTTTPQPTVSTESVTSTSGADIQETTLATTIETTESEFQSTYGIDLLVNVLGVKFMDVCTNPHLRFRQLELAVAQLLQLNPVQASSLCQNTTTEASDSSSDSEDSDESSESDDSDDSEETEEIQENVPPFQRAIVRLRFDNKGSYLQTLHSVLKHVRNIYKQVDSSSSDNSVEREFRISMEELSGQIGRQLSNLLRKLVRVEVLRVSGNA